jgi:ubiquinone/menaquinone biosynthesis C-methylase UbiE
LSLKHVQAAYEKWGEKDPMYAVLSHSDKRGQKWDPEAFFRTGREEIQKVLAYVQEVTPDLQISGALDFGCGVGRLSQALGDSVAEVVGVDISDTMVAEARRFDRHEGRVQYVVNTEPDLSQFPDDHFDLVYSNITLQHMPPRYSKQYIADFFRVIRPGGVVLFQLRSGPRIEPGSLRDRIYTFNREPLRRLFQRLRGRPPSEYHFVARSQVEEVIHGSGGRLLDVVDLGGKDVLRRHFRYCATV